MIDVVLHHEPPKSSCPCSALRALFGRGREQNNRRVIAIPKSVGATASDGGRREAYPVEEEVAHHQPIVLPPTH